MMDDTLPKVSIVLPTHNGAKYIQRSIDSCLNQTYKNIELIIVDDGSTDNTAEIIKSYNDNRIIYLRHEKNKGLPAALNTGFSKSCGEYLSWTSDDNYYAKKAVEKMLAFMRRKKCSFVYSDYYQFKNENPSQMTLMKSPDDLTLTVRNIIGACFMYSKEVMTNVGDYDPSAELAEDYDYWIRVSKKFTMCHLGEPLYFYRVHDESLYESRYYEVNVVDVLVRLKNGISDLNDVTNLLINLLARKRGGYLRLNKALAVILYSKGIKNILRDFNENKISFKNAKLKLEKKFGRHKTVRDRA